MWRSATGAALVLLPQTVLAASPNDTPTGHPALDEPHQQLEIGGEAEIGGGLGGMACSRSFDVQDCETTVLLAGLLGTVRFRPVSWLSLGVLGAYGTTMLGNQGSASSDGSRTELGRTLWRTSFEARVIPLQWGRGELWLGAEGGVAGARDSTTWYPGGRTDSLTRRTLALGIGAGIDWLVLPQLSLGPAVRLLSIPLGKEPFPGADRADAVHPTWYTSPIWFTIGMTVSARVPL